MKNTVIICIVISWVLISLKLAYTGLKVIVCVFNNEHYNVEIYRKHPLDNKTMTVEPFNLNQFMLFTIFLFCCLYCNVKRRAQLYSVGSYCQCPQRLPTLDVYKRPPVLNSVAMYISRYWMILLGYFDGAKIWGWENTVGMNSLWI